MVLAGTRHVLGDPRAYAGVLLGVAAWWGVVQALDVPEYLVPPPAAIVRSFAEAPAYYLTAVAYTLGEALAGLALALVLGLAVALPASARPRLGGAAMTVAGALQTMPIIAIAPLMVLWLGPGFASKVMMAALVAMGPVIVATVRGVRSPPQDLLTTLIVMGCRRIDVFCSVILPYALRQITVGMHVAASLSVIGAIVAEYTGSLNGLGYTIMQASYRANTPGLFCGALLSVLCGLIMVKVSRLAGLVINHVVVGLQVSGR